MTKKIVMAIAAMLLLCTSLIISRAITAERIDLVVDMLLEVGPEADSQTRFLIDPIASIINSDNSGFSVTRKSFTNPDDFYRHIRTTRPDLIIVDRKQHYTNLIENYGYEPRATFGMVGITENRTCIFVRETSPAKTVADLRGKPISTYEGTEGYISMWNLADSPPESFFGKLEFSQSALGSFYHYSLQTTEAVLSSELLYRFLKEANPGIVQGVRRLKCGHPYRLIPLLTPREQPETITGKILETLKKIENGKSGKGMFQIFSNLKIHFYRTSPKDYESDIDMFRKARKNGQIAHYEQWLAKQKRSAK